MLDDYNEFQKSYKDESDRSVVILAGSFIEMTLEKYLRMKLVDSESVAQLFSGYAPLATFSAKIEVGFALGLLPVHVYQDLKVVKKLRNIFAHEVEPWNFDSQRVGDICANFNKIKRTDGSSWELTSAREKFLSAVFFSLLHIDTESKRISRLVVPKFRFVEDVEDSGD